MKPINLADYVELAKAQRSNQGVAAIWCPACEISYMRKRVLLNKSGKPRYAYRYEKRRMVECSICRGDGEIAEAFYVACHACDVVLRGLLCPFCSWNFKPSIF